MPHKRHLIAVIGVALAGAAALGATWAVPLVSASTAQAQSGVLTAPGIPTFTVCKPHPVSLAIAWTASTHASSYSILTSTTASTGPFTSVAVVPSSTLTWTLPSPGTATHWFEITALVGTKWMATSAVSTSCRT